MQEIKMLTGAILYEVDKGAAQQVEVMKLFLLSHPQFSGLTVNEVRHAFYLNNQGEYDEVYKHYNKELNAEFVGNVLLAYIKYKTAIYNRKGNAIKQLIEPKEAVKVILPSEAECQRAIQHDYDNYLDGKREFVFVDTLKYKLIRQYGGIQIYSRRNWYNLLGRAMDERERYGKTSLGRKDIREKENILKVKDIYRTYRTEGWIPGEEFKIVIHTLQKQQYYRFLKMMQYFKIKNIFNEIICKK